MAFLSPAIAASAAAPSSIRALDAVTLEWGVNPLYQSASDASGASCNFFSAGTGSTYSSDSGPVMILKRNAAGAPVEVTESSKCLPVDGSALNQRVLFTAGHGTFDQASGTGEIAWDGGFRANAYGGLSPWWVDDVRLVIENGAGTLRGTVSGPDVTPGAPSDTVTMRDAVLATFSDARVSDTGVELTPDFRGVDYHALGADGQREKTSAIGDDVKQKNPNWGSWPESFVDFHYRSGLSTYWHTSGGGADPDKGPLDVRIAFSGAKPTFEAPSLVAGPSRFDGIIGRQATFTSTFAGADPLDYQWQIKRTGAAWTDIDGATAATLTIDALTAADNRAYVRVTATNPHGSVTSPQAYLTAVPYVPVRALLDPFDTAGVADSIAEFTFRFEGAPAPSFSLEISRDGGASWAAWEGASVTTQSVAPKNQVAVTPKLSVADDGALVRARAATADESATTAAVRLRVAANTGAPQLAVSPIAPLDPTVDNTIWVSSNNLAVPGDWKGSLVLSVFERGVWEPGQTGSSKWVAVNAAQATGSIPAQQIRARGGFVPPKAIVIPAGALDPQKRYVVAAFAQQPVGTFTDRILDAASTLPVERPSAIGDPSISEPTADSATVAVTVTPAGVERSVHVEYGIGAGDAVLGNDPASGRGAAPSSQEGAVTTTPVQQVRGEADPTELSFVLEPLRADAGYSYRVVSTDADGQREESAWSGFRTPGAGSGSGPGGTPAASGADTSLSSTGFGGAVPSLVGVSVLLLGAALLAASRLRRLGAVAG